MTSFASGAFKPLHLPQECPSHHLAHAIPLCTDNYKFNGERIRLEGEGGGVPHYLSVLTTRQESHSLLFYSVSMTKWNGFNQRKHFISA